ncbi:DJ-1/PfpI family protein [Acidimicrobiia bacterium EGI L10123]|uniref:DJ-1/PfpI family protein n=1 Tax=Salinilacustrithrix flava TaxID=2957203 RepID=UPI003D7C2253|nr:DJ-1/PfpI family protein [Acidimicrobiia bacterium EGI L10123]
MQIAIALFPRLTALDAIGPYEVLQRLPDATVTFVGEQTGEVRSENGFLGLRVDATFDDVPDPDVVVVPGGVGTRALMAEGSAIHDWLRTAHETSRFTTSVCTGSLVLGAAGLLDGLTATTHWSAYDILRKTGAEPAGQRVVEHLDRRIITAAGVSAGIDMALRLAELLVDADAARAMQLMIEYDPQPPFDAGSVDKAGEAVMARLTEYSATKD